MTIKMTREEIVNNLYIYDLQPFYFLCKSCNKVNTVYAVYTGDMLKCNNCGSADIELIEVVDG